MVHGLKGSCPYVGCIPAQPRLGIPALHLEDGPSGVADHAAGVTAWPGGLALASTWDRALWRRFGAALAAEHRAKGVSVVLGPGMCLARVPTCGRNWEYLGEDPYLAARAAQELVRAIQAGGVIACAKHYIDNNQETERHEMSAQVGERAQRELYLEPFRGAVEGGAGAVMCAFNRVNGTYACENRHTRGSRNTMKDATSYSTSFIQRVLKAVPWPHSCQRESPEDV